TTRQAVMRPKRSSRPATWSAITARNAWRGFTPWKSILTGLCMRTVLQMSHFELLAREAELGESIFQMVGQQRHSQQIRGRALVVQASGFRAQVLPIFERAVAATEPSHGYQIDLLVLGQRPDEASQLRSNGIVSVVLQHGDHGVVRGIGCVIRDGHHVLGIELARLDYDETDLFG